MVTAAKANRKRQDGKVILHVYVDPGVRQGIKLLSTLWSGEANDVLRELVGKELAVKNLPVPAGIAPGA